MHKTFPLFEGVGGIVPHQLFAPVEDIDTGEGGLSSDMAFDDMINAIEREASQEKEQIKNACSHMTASEFYVANTKQLKAITGKDFADTFQEHLTDIDKEFAQEQHLFNINGTNCFSVGDIQLICGVQKCGKTFALTMLCGALLRGSYNGIKSLVDSPKVLYFDTEQKEQKTATLAKRVRRIVYNGEPTDKQKIDFKGKFKIANLREFGTVDERLQYIITTLFCLSQNGFKPNLVVLDGVADIIHNFNDNEECDNTIRKLMQISTIFNCCFVSVLHYNKDGRTEKGHLGALYLNKVSDAWNVTKHDKAEANNKDGVTYFELKHSHARDTDNCTPVFYTIDNNGLPTHYINAPTKYNKLDIQNYAVEVIQESGGAINTTKLYEGIAIKVKHYNGIETTASNLRKQYEYDLKCDNRIICEAQGKSILYKLKYQSTQDIKFSEPVGQRDETPDYPF